MKARYFAAATQEACLKEAEAYFGRDRDQLYHRFMPAQGGENQMLWAVDPAPAELAATQHMDAAYGLVYTGEGVLLELFIPQGHGQKLDTERLYVYLRRKNLAGLNMSALNMLVNQGWGSVLVAPPQQERLLDEEAAITVDEAESKAFARILPADPGGKALDEEALRQSLAAAGVTHGIDEAALEALLAEKKLFHKYLVARATPPRRGQNGQLIFHFRREFSGRPKIDETGRVDYRTLDLFENVQAGQELLTRVPATAGVPGYSVRGREIPADRGRDARMPGGKNVTVNEEGTKMRAACSGMVVYTGASINVSNVYSIANADMTVGNIDFDGSVIISGNVITGLTIQASGNIEVGGVVECANLIAGGNIVLKRGMQGASKGLLQAQGNITANYIERANVIAGGTITANIISHSIVEAGDSLILAGKIGSLAGGQTRVSNTISAHVIGAPVEMPTDVEVGLVPHKRERIKFLHNELKRLPDEIEKLSTIIDYLERNPGDDGKRFSMHLTVSQSLYHNRQLLEEYSEEMETLTEESANAIHGKVHVSDTIYPGVRLTIANSLYKVNMPTTHCSFRVVDGEVIMGAFEG